MTFVPVVTPPPSASPPSPRTRELADLLTKVLREYTKAHPSTTGAEVRQALRLAATAAGSDKAPTAILLSLVMGVLLAVAGTLGLLLSRGTGEVDLAEGMPMVIMALMVFLVLVMVAVRLRGR